MSHRLGLTQLVVYSAVQTRAPPSLFASSSIVGGGQGRTLVSRFFDHLLQSWVSSPTIHLPRFSLSRKRKTLCTVGCAYRISFQTKSLTVLGVLPTHRSESAQKISRFCNLKVTSTSPKNLRSRGTFK